MTPVGVFFCWQGGAERDFVNSTIFNQVIKAHQGIILRNIYLHHTAGISEETEGIEIDEHLKGTKSVCANLIKELRIKCLYSIWVNVKEDIVSAFIL